MGTIQKINWRNPLVLLGLFSLLALLLSVAWNVLQAVHNDPDPEQTVSVSLTHDQAKEVASFINQYVEAGLRKKDSVTRREVTAAFAEILRTSIPYQAFLNQQSERDEKYNAAATAADPELMRQWADRYPAQGR